TNSVHTVVFDEGETYASFHLQIIDDTVVEGPETVNLALVNPTGGAVIGEQPEATLTIVSDDSVISFLTSTYSVSENVLSGSAVISVIRTGATNTSVSVDYRTEDGSASAPADYSAVSDTLTFTLGEMIKSFLVPIRNDNIIEGNETVFLRLTNATAGNVL